VGWAVVSVCQAVEEVLQFNRQHFLATHLSKAARKAKDTFDGEAIISYHNTREKLYLLYGVRLCCLAIAEAFSRPIMARLPLTPEALVMECHRARAAAEATVKK
jgi:hypothetical protein